MRGVSVGASKGPGAPPSNGSWSSPATSPPGRSGGALHESALTHFRSVRFVDATGQRGTNICVHLEYVPPAGSLGTALTRVSGQSPQRLVREALQRLKQLMETAGARKTFARST